MRRSLFMASQSVALSAAVLAVASAPASARPAYPGYSPGYFSGAPVGHYGGDYGGYRPGYFSSYSGGYHPSYPPGFDPYHRYNGAPTPYTAPWAYFSAGGGEEVVGDTVIGGRYVPPSAAPAAAASPPGPNLAPAPVTMNVHVPPSADVWFDGYQTNRTGEWRAFRSEPVAPGRDYFYTVRARWTENGREADQTRRVKVHADEETTVDFTRPAPDSAAPK